MKVFFSPHYEVILPGHVWPTSKYRLIAERLAAGPHSAACEFHEPPEASWDDLGLVHTAEYLAKLRDGTLTADDIATLELPWQPGFATAFRLMAGGTCAAAAAALDEGRAAHLGGGLHHAFANHGEGFCPLNDVAVAIRVAQARHHVRRAAVVDLDVHHGNGTAMIFERDPDVFTLSIHQQHNYPFFKPRSGLDVGLEDGAGDARYLDALRAALPRVLASDPELIVYVAGADPFEHDRLGGLRLTKAGLAERDRLVVQAARAAGVPLALTLAGGYALDVRDIVDIQTATVETLLMA
ncbi:MAG TPA: histone deacetylase [Vicinamibacterales bacterium]|nr:histone deacetylase [Vicinamibacterales bacterium]